MDSRPEGASDGFAFRIPAFGPEGLVNEVVTDAHFGIGQGMQTILRVDATSRCVPVFQAQTKCWPFSKSWGR